MDKIVLDYLNEQKEFPNSYDLVKGVHKTHEEVVGGLKSLESKNYLKLTQKKVQKY